MADYSISKSKKDTEEAWNLSHVISFVFVYISVLYHLFLLLPGDFCAVMTETTESSLDYY